MGHWLNSTVGYKSSTSEVALLLSPCGNLGNRHKNISCCSFMSVEVRRGNGGSVKQKAATSACVSLGYGRKPGSRMCNYAKGNENTGVEYCLL